MPSLRELLQRGLEAADEAVQADQSGSYTLAARLYEDSVKYIDSALASSATAHGENSMTEEERDKMTEFARAYMNRAEYIASHFPDQAHDLDPSLTAFQFKEIDTTDVPAPEQPPESLERRPYWLMRVLHKTMTTGGYLTPKLYVPWNVWFQLGARFTAIETKFACCEMVLLYLQRLKDEDITDTTVLLKDLDEFCRQLDVIQNQLARKLTYVDEIKIKDKSQLSLASGKFAQVIANKVSKSVERMHAAYVREKIDDDSAYIELLVKVFENVQFMDGWLTHFESISATAVLGKLRRVSEFFNLVVCAFVIRDFNVLLERYMKKTRQSYLLT